MASVDAAATAEALGTLIEATERIETGRLGSRIDIGAELYPRVSEDRKTAAAFYTQSATAELLAALTITRDSLPTEAWQREDLLRKHVLADLACGTGTLLRAGCRRLLTLHEEACAGHDGDMKRNLHTDGMEHGFVGTDLSPIAAHLTATSLAALGNAEAYGSTRIGWVEVGGPRDAVGALEFFDTAEVGDLFSNIGGRSAGGASDRETSGVVVLDESCDWILMNPPYSRTRRGQSVFDVAGLSETERKACQKRWGALTKNKPFNKKAGMAASFLALAIQKLKPDGKLGFVLPLTAAFADSWRETRRHLEAACTDILVIGVTQRTNARDSFSADTHMEEMLLVAKKRGPSNRASRRSLRCATLTRPVTRLGEAAELARVIESAMGKIDEPGSTVPVRAGRERVGEAVVFETRENGDEWHPLGVMHPEVSLTARGLADGRGFAFGDREFSLHVAMKPIEEVFEVGPTHHLIGHLEGNDRIGAFTFYPVADAGDAVGSDRALWAADAKKQNRLVVQPSHRGVPSDGNDVTAEKRREIRQSTSRLHYARGMRWTSQALLAATTRRPAMGGSAWTSLKHPDERVCRTFALWANSTLGLLVHWTHGQRTHIGRSRTQVGALSRIPCPDLDALEDARLDAADAAFRRLSERRTLLPACQAHADPVRKALDATVLDMLGLGGAGDVLEDVRRLWCEEWSVHGNNRVALALLGR